MSTISIPAHTDAFKHALAIRGGHSLYCIVCHIDVHSIYSTRPSEGITLAGAVAQHNINVSK